MGRSKHDGRILIKYLSQTFDDQKLESEFRREFMEKVTTAAGWMLLFGSFLYVGYYLAFDAIFGPSSFAKSALVRSVGGVLIGTGAALSFMRRGRWLLVYIIRAFVILVAASLAYIISYLPPQEAFHYYGGLLVVQFFLFSSGLYLMREALLITVAINIFYGLIPLIGGPVADNYYSTLMYLLSTSAIGVTATYYIERLLRRDFLFRRQLGEETARSQRLAEQAERANLSKSKFLAAASHDLRQPVQSLFLFAATLEESLKAHPASKMVGYMQQSLNALKMLLDSLLDVSRLDAGIIEVRQKAFPLGELLDRLTAEYTPRAESKGLVLRLVPTSAWVQSDPALLERMLRNLIENALKYTQVGHVLLGVRRRKGAVQVVVADTGPGIPPERQQDIFEEFVQIGNPERDREKGLGLGLAIVQRLSQLLHHAVLVRSIPGKGSLFAIELPLAKAVQPQVDTWVRSNTTERHGIVLVVDDEAPIRTGLRSVLEGWGYKVWEAESSVEALALLQQHAHAPDVIIADYRLRGETGLDVLQQLDAACKRPLPGFLLTGDTDLIRFQKAQADGIPILQKPVHPADLQRALDEAQKQTA